MKTVFTTGEAAKICKVSSKPLFAVLDSGQLKGFRVPGSRIAESRESSFYTFLRDNGHPDRRPGKRPNGRY